MTSVSESIRSRRESLGLSPAAVARLARVDPARVSEIESGAALTVLELDRIASALVIEPSDLRTTGALEDPRWSVARFRMPLAGEKPSALDTRTLARAAEAGRVHAFLMETLGRKTGQVRALRTVRPLQAQLPWQDGYSLGKQARERLSPRHEAIPSMQALLESAGVLVLTLDLESERIEAASLTVPDGSPVIVLNRSLDKMRNTLPRRAALAHELCHLLHDSNAERDLCTVFSEVDDKNPIEQRANGFAPSFLAPKDWVSRSTKSTPEQQIASLARTWGLSFEGAVWHAKNLKWFGQARAQELIAHPPRHSLASDFELEMERRSPSEIGLEIEASAFARSALGDLAIEAALRDEISAGRAAEVLTFQ